MTGATDTIDSQEPLFIAGATGYIGSRLVPRLLEAGYRVRCLARDRQKLAARPWSHHPQLESIEGDISDPSRLVEAMAGCSAAYYLIQATDTTGVDADARERNLADNFAHAAKRADLRRVICLDRLPRRQGRLDISTGSRRPIAQPLASGPCPVTRFRTAMIIGSCSASFEILRALVDPLPVVLAPRALTARCRPIAISNVLHYLVTCLEEPKTVGVSLQIGGAGVVTYGELLRLTADALRLPGRVIVPLPILTPYTSSQWVHLLTPVGRDSAHHLAPGPRDHEVCRDDDAIRLMPQRLLTVREAITAAVSEAKTSDIQSAWSDAGLLPRSLDSSNGRVYRDRRTTVIGASPQHVFQTVCRIGGHQGYYAANWLWRIRGWMDRILGGPGLHRGRRDPKHVGYGDAIDFWRVTRVEPDRLLRLQAEMKLPGQAMLEFEVSADGQTGDTSRLTQTALFKPDGLAGTAYWHSIIPLHSIVFGGMIAGIRRAAEGSPQSKT